jgi:serine/threonine-protein phosphatase 2A regulatory subunit A
MQVLPIVVSAVKDESWRVRWAVANKFCDICSVVSNGSPSEQLLECYIGLLGDVEAEVRAAAAHKLLEVSKTLKPEFILAKVLFSVLSHLRSLCVFISLLRLILRDARRCYPCIFKSVSSASTYNQL